MTPEEPICEIENLTLPYPVLVLSNRAGWGMYRVGQAIQERLDGAGPVRHFAVEDFLDEAAVSKELLRYRKICDTFPSLLHLMYKVPFFYRRKYLKQRNSAGEQALKLVHEIERFQPRTLICVSHRAAFWAGAIRGRLKQPPAIYAVLAEYGVNLGWKYLFWENIDFFCTPLDPAELPGHIRRRKKPVVLKMRLPVRREFLKADCGAGDFHKILITGGGWGLGRVETVVRALTRRLSGWFGHVVCGDNSALAQKMRRLSTACPIRVHENLPSLAPLMKECQSVITKPGIATLIEAHSLGRKIFLIPGLPVNEDFNATYAIRHLGAEWFSPAAFSQWYEGHDQGD